MFFLSRPISHLAFPPPRIPSSFGGRPSAPMASGQSLSLSDEDFSFLKIAAYAQIVSSAWICNPLLIFYFVFPNPHPQPPFSSRSPQDLIYEPPMDAHKYPARSNSHDSCALITVAFNLGSASCYISDPQGLPPVPPFPGVTIWRAS